MQWTKLPGGQSTPAFEALCSRLVAGETVQEKDTVHAGDTIMAQDIAKKTLSTFEGIRSEAESITPRLTERELEVVRALAMGKSNKEIAKSLGISEKTVRNHASNIYKKLHIFDRTQAVIYAIRQGLVDVEELEPR